MARAVDVEVLPDGGAFRRDGPARVVFGFGAEGRVADELGDLGARRVMLVAQSHHRAGADRIAARLGERCVGVFDGVRQHVPLDALTHARSMARDRRADWVVAHGGGSPIGFAKGIALTEPVQVAAVPTTYSGSERTRIWGITDGTAKRTGRDERVRPSLVVYDPELTLQLPRDVSLSSLFNSLAHVIGMLWQPSTPEDGARAGRTATGLVQALRAVGRDPGDRAARIQAMHAAYLAAAWIERAPLALQHLLAHVIGGMFDTPHARTHTVLLPYTTAFNGVEVPSAMVSLDAALGADPPAALYDLARELEQPHDLRALGLDWGDLPRVVEQAMTRDYPNPRPLSADALGAVLERAYHGRRPSLRTRSLTLQGAGPHTVVPATVAGADPARARAVIVALHGRGGSADRLVDELLRVLGDELATRVCLLAPQALDNSWYPKPFTDPPATNQPHLESALSMVDGAWAAACAERPPTRVLVVGFSQGACLALAWARTREHRPGGLLALSGAGLDLEGDYRNLSDAMVYLSKSEGDRWLPPSVFDRTAVALQRDCPTARVHREPGDGHAIYDADAAALAEAVERAMERD